MKKPKVFISYSWDSDEHKSYVKDFVDKLGSKDIFEIKFDKYVKLTPNGGWIDWMIKEIKSADFIIIVCTKKYYDFFEFNKPNEGKGVAWESKLIKGEIYNRVKDISTIVPIFLNSKDIKYKPSLFDCTTFNLEKEEFEKLCENIQGKWQEKFDDNIVQNDTDFLTSPETGKIKSFLKQININLFKQKVYQYLPISYFSTLPNTHDKILDKLISIGSYENTIPLLCVLKNLKSHEEIDKYISYLETNTFHSIQELKCSENKEVKELSFLINCLEEDGKDTYQITTWRYANNEMHQILETFQTVNLNSTDDLGKYLDAIYSYAEEITAIYGSEIYFEIILPTYELYKGIKNWQDSNGYSLIRKYKYVLRLQSRFMQPTNIWTKKWEELDIVNNKNFIISDENKVIEDVTYYNSLSSINYSAVLKEKIDNPEVLIQDVEEFGISIVLSPFVDTLKEKNIKICDCKKTICEYIMSNHNNEKSDLLFVLDNPEKIPENFKTPENNLYGY